MDLKNLTYQQIEWEKRLNNYEQHGCIKWHVYIATKRENRKFVPTGNFKIVAEPFTFDVAVGLRNAPIIHYVTKLTNKQIQNIKKRFYPIAKTAQIIAWYRKTPIIPDHISKLHHSRIKKYGYEYYTEEFNRFASAQLWKYMIHFGKCPDCKSRGFSETIFGIKCNHCDYSIHDYKDKLEIVTAKTALEKYKI